MPLEVVSVHDGIARLGSWGTVELTGSATAVLRTNLADNLELPESVAADLTAGVLLLNEAVGRVLFLPYAGEMVVAYDLKEGAPAYEPMTVPRADDRGLRMAIVRRVPHFGAVYLTEATLACFNEDCTPVWRHDEDFAGWTIDRITDKEVLLLASDWVGNEQRQSRALADGRTLS